MAKKKNSKKRRNSKPAVIRETIIKDLMPEITKDTVDMEPVEETESNVYEIKSDGSSDVIEAQESDSASLTELTKSSEATTSIEPVTQAEPAASVEPVEQAEPAASIESAESVESVTSAVTENNELEISASPKAEVTDFTLVMGSPVVNKQVEADAENAENTNSGTANAENAQLEAEYAAARATGPSKSTAITPIIPVTGYDDVQSNMSQANKAKGKRSKTVSFKADASHYAGKVKGIFDKPVTRKFLAAALGLTLVLNGAIAAGIMSLYSHGIKKDVSAVKETVSELESRSVNPGDFGNGGPDLGMTPPGMNNDNSWGNDDNYFGGDDSDYGEHWDDDWSDDWNDDSLNGGSVPYSGNEQNQASSSGASIGIVISDNNGVYVTQVTGSNAQKAGFQAGDKIVAFDGDDISSSNELIEEVQEHKSGDTVKVVVDRNGKQVKINTTLE